MSNKKVKKNLTDLFSDSSLRPKSLDKFIGQEQLKEQLKIFIDAAKQREEALEHVLFYGPPGLGKTTLACILAREMKTDIKIISGPTLSRAGDLASILTNLDDGDILFIDEVHRLNKVVEETLYPAMEDYALDIIVGKGPSARSIRLKLKKFTVVGATTRIGLISSPMRGRFGLVKKLDFYDPENLGKIIINSAQLLNVEVDEEGALVIARRCRGTPRIANRLLKRVRDFAQVEKNGYVDKECAIEALARMGIDEKGLTKVDRHLLRLIVENYQGGPVGLDNLAASLIEDTDTIVDVYEPYLMKLGLLKRTSRGRVVTKEGKQHIGALEGEQKKLIDDA